MPAPTDAEVSALAHEILAQPRYRRWRPDAGADTGLLPWLLDQLARFTAWMAELHQTNPLAWWLVMLALGAVTALLLAHLVWSVRAALAGAPPPPPVAEPARSLVDDALDLADGGRHLDAARLVQLAVIEMLVTHGTIELGRADPNRTLRDRLARAPLPPALRAECVRLIDRLERGWFRDRLDDPDLYTDWLGLHRRLAATIPP